MIRNGEITNFVEYMALYIHIYFYRFIDRIRNRQRKRR